MIDESFPLYFLCFTLCFTFTVIIERKLIPVLSGKAKQPIYEDGPKWHMSKKGTPTMGGLAFVISVTLTLLLGTLYLLLLEKSDEALSLAFCLLYAILNSLIGIIDDITKLRRKENAGLSPRQKLVLQFLSASIFLTLRALFTNEPTVISFADGSFNTGILYYPMALIILVGITNFANLTDGIDGLAGGVAFAVAVSLFYISCALSESGAFISSAIMGATISFLIFNLHPAKIFMGDTGSLFLGSILASVAVVLGNPLLILMIGGVWCIEGASVVIQVAVYKLTGKRVFKMAPLHHHLERNGWSEYRICIVAILISLLLAIPAFAIYLP